MFCQLYGSALSNSTKTKPLLRSNYQAVKKERASSPCVPLTRLLQQIQGGRQFCLHQSANIFSGTSDLRSSLKSSKIENFDQVIPDLSSKCYFEKNFCLSSLNLSHTKSDSHFLAAPPHQAGAQCCSREPSSRQS